MNNTTDIILSRLTAQQRTMDVVAGNIANASTPGYRAQRVVFADWLASETSTGIARGDRQLAFTQDRLRAILDQATNPAALELAARQLNLPLQATVITAGTLRPTSR